MVGAIVHEWIEGAGGAEKVVDALAAEYQDADIYALWNDAPARYENHRVYETWLACSRLRLHKALAVPFLLPTWRRLNARTNYDWMIVSSHLFAHHARFSGLEIPKYVYAHTPARYIWTPELDERGNNPFARAAAPILKKIDKHRAAEAVSVAANSAYVKARIERTWEIDARVIYPPVSVRDIVNGGDWRNALDPAEQDLVASLPEGFLLGASRFIPYKRLDSVIRTGAVANRPVVIAGSGPDSERLRAIAKELRVPVTFIPSPSTPLLYSLYQQAAAYVFPAVEDFGIMPVEAMAAGARVVTLSFGGAAESVVDRVSGAWSPSAQAQDLAEAVQRAQAIDPQEAIRRAMLFDKDEFSRRVRDWIGLASLQN